MELIEQKIEILQRPRRNRKSPAIRDIIQETRLHPSQLIAPLFLIEGHDKKDPILSMPEVYRLSLDKAVEEIFELYSHGIRAIDLFAYIPKEKKDAYGTEAVRENNLIQQAVRLIKSECPDMCVMVDVALDPYTDHGHDGLIDANGYVSNDESLDVLGRMSLLAAEAGADVIAPSDMMDGRVGYIRKKLDENGFTNVSILSYAAKYTSAFYGPFREALNSAPKVGDKKGYQLNPANWREAMRECELDIAEGADMLLIKPALPYLDIITKVRETTNLPVGAFHVSGEYAMVMAAAKNGWIDADRAFMECLISIKRAGADFILTYAALRTAKLLK